MNEYSEHKFVSIYRDKWNKRDNEIWEKLDTEEQDSINDIISKIDRNMPFVENDREKYGLEEIGDRLIIRLPNLRGNATTLNTYWVLEKYTSGDLRKLKRFQYKSQRLVIGNKVGTDVSDVLDNIWKSSSQDSKYSIVTRMIYEKI